MNGIDTYVPGIHVGEVMRAGGLGEVVRSRSAGTPKATSCSG